MRAWLYIAFIAACSGSHAEVPDAPPEPDVDADPGLVLPTPIRYVVVIVKENHTFDNYFTGFPGAATSAMAQLSSGAFITRPPAPSNGAPAVDVAHSRRCAVTAYA